MPTHSYITDPKTKKKVCVTKNNQLVVAPISYNESYFNSMNVANTAFNFVSPKTGKIFILESVIFSSNKNVSATNGAQIEIYESGSPSSTIISKELFTLDIAKLESKDIARLNYKTTEGAWINAKTDSATTNVTILGYYINA